MNTKMLTVEFVNQSASNMSQNLMGKRYDKTDMAELLGNMNREWQLLHSRINDGQKRTEQLLDRWNEFERELEELEKFMEEENNKLQRHDGKVGQVAYVMQVLNVCQVGQRSKRIFVVV